MTPRKTATSKAKPPAKGTRKKSTPRQPDLLEASAPAELSESDAEMPSEGADKEAEQSLGSATGHPESTAPSSQQSTTPSASGEPGLVPPGKLAPSEAVASGGVRMDTASQTWLLATNHLNLLHMLAAGMAMGPAGFAGKYYRDPSGELSGLVPLFRDGVPEAAIQQAISEQRHLRPCIAEIDLTGLNGQVHVVSRNGEVSSGALPLRIDSEVSALLVGAPLPMTLVKRLVFRSPGDRKEFEASAHSFANIDLTDLSIETSEQFFYSEHPMVWPLHGHLEDITRDRFDQPSARGEAIGGCLAMLYHLANRSDLCCSAYRAASGAGTPDDYNALQQDAVLAELASWVESGGPRPGSQVQARLFWGVVEALMSASLSGSAESPLDVVLGFLDDQLAELQDARYRPRLEQLISDMRSTFGLGGGTISQLFERHKGTLSRPLLLFCLREHCVDLLEFQHPSLNDEELIAAAVLFGGRDGWIGLPVELRTPKALSQFVEQRMFEAECNQRRVRLSLDKTAIRPIPLRELLNDSGNVWSKARKASLARVASRTGWQDCVVSRIRLPQGQYRLNISADGIEVVVRGDVGPPDVEIDRGGLLKKISQWPPVLRDVENEVRAALGSRD